MNDYKIVVDKTSIDTIVKFKAFAEYKDFWNKMSIFLLLPIVVFANLGLSFLLNIAEHRKQPVEIFAVMSILVAIPLVFFATKRKRYTFEYFHQREKKLLDDTIYSAKVKIEMEKLIRGDN